MLFDMMRTHNRPIQAGFTLVELIFVTAISVLIFGALFTSFQFSLELIATSRAKLSALSLANDRMEFFRSLPYDNVGVLAGFPAGTIAQTSVLSLNGIEFDERVRVDYVDDSADDVAGVDGNGVITDFKQIRLEYSWEVAGDLKKLALSSYIVPRAVETNVGGGTARINVLDADGTLLPGASVRLFSASTTFNYDVTNPANAAGTALFAVPADSGYQVEVTASIGGQPYSTSSTYLPSTANPNPVVGPFAVLEADVSTLTFQIGELSDLNINVFSSLVEDSAVETFSDAGGIASSTGQSAVAGGVVRLADTAGGYQPTGQLWLSPVSPATLEQWEVIRLVSSVPTDTDFQIQLFTGDAITGYTLIPTSALPGNSIGFTDTLIDVRLLDPVEYPTITIGVLLETANSTVSPSIDEIEVYWRESSTSRSGLAGNVRGTKTIGTLVDGSPVYKTIISDTTDVSGRIELPDLEFDSYTMQPTTALDLAVACPAYPIVHRAGITSTVELLFVPDVLHTVRVLVVDGLERALPGATVRLDRSGYDVSHSTNTCGQVFFTGGLSDDSDYTLTVSAPGFVTQQIDSFSITGDVSSVITLLP